MTHKHTYDEHGLCFECDRPQTPAARRAKADAKKRDSGLVRLQVWVTADQKKKVLEMLKGT